MTRRVCLMAFSMFMVWCCAVLWVRGSDPDTGKKTITNSIGMKLVLIPAGEFLMGSPEGEAERQDDEYQHRVRITKSFYLGVYEVTQGEYEQVMGTNPSYFAPGRPWTRPADFAGQGTSHFPVEQLSWHDAVEFCRKLSSRWAESSVGRVYRLPTEAEWEYACRAGTTTPFHFGATLNGREANCDANFPYGTKVGGIDLFRTTRVGSYGANGFGLCDMHGNVWEWCADWKGEYGTTAVDDPSGATAGSFRVFRGGGWSYGARGCRSAFRYFNSPEYRFSSLGFRVASSSVDGSSK